LISRTKAGNSRASMPSVAMPARISSFLHTTIASYPGGRFGMIGRIASCFLGTIPVDRRASAVPSAWWPICFSYEPFLLP
jgi:hypothetical protein